MNGGGFLIKGLAFPCVAESVSMPHISLSACLTKESAQEFVGKPILDECFKQQLGKVIEIECVGTNLYVYAVLDARPLHNGLGVTMVLDINADGIVKAVKPTGIAILADTFWPECKIEWCVPIPNRKKRLYAQEGFRLQRDAL